MWPRTRRAGAAPAPALQALLVRFARLSAGEGYLWVRAEGPGRRVSDPVTLRNAIAPYSNELAPRVSYSADSGRQASYIPLMPTGEGVDPRQPCGGGRHARRGSRTAKSAWSNRLSTRSGRSPPRWFDAVTTPPAQAPGCPRTQKKKKLLERVSMPYRHGLRGNWGTRTFSRSQADRGAILPRASAVLS